MPNTSDAVPLISTTSHLLTYTVLLHTPLSRHVLQLHHDDGGEQCGVDCGGAQLSPQDRRDPRHAYVGAECFSPVAALDPEDGQT